MCAPKVTVIAKSLAMYCEIVVCELFFNDRRASARVSERVREGCKSCLRAAMTLKKGRRYCEIGDCEIVDCEIFCL